MSMEMYRQRMLQDETMGALNPALAAAGMFEDARGNVYYGDGVIAYGPDVNALSRARVTRGAIPLTVNPTSQLVTLPNGQQFTQEQYQALLAQQGQQQLVSGGVSNQGVNIGGLSVSWVTLAVVIGAVVLLQSRPVSRGGK